RVVSPTSSGYAPWQLIGLAAFVEAAQRHGRKLHQLADEATIDHVRHMLAEARRLAADEKAAAPLRLTAVGALGWESEQRDAELETLIKLLAPQNSAELQAAAMTALGRIPDDRVPQTLATAWKGCTPSLRAQALDLLLSRTAWQRQLLLALEEKQIPASQLDAKRRQVLLTHKD